MSNSFSLQITNDRIGDENQINLLFTADAVSGLTGIKQNVSTTLTDFKSSNSNMTISMETVKSGRLYVGYGKLPAAPVPDGPQYFGWIEFSRITLADNVWINLSNVDITGLPLALAGKANGQSWTLGYKNSITDVISQLKKNALSNNDALITCTSGQQKVVGPNIVPSSYTSYDTYLQSLMNAKAALVITSDTPSTGTAKVFTGTFLNASADTDPIISMTSAEGDTFQVLKGQFTTPLIYQCDGGTLIYNGTTYPQNRTATNDPKGSIDNQTITNSTYRNLLIGMNEGYFSATGTNYSANFGGLTPFTNGGSAYAQVLHENSNSYGFPYADSNLKVLIQASPSDLLTMTIMTDTEAKNYDSNPPENGNQPNSGNYQFGIGAGSSALGAITIGGWVYQPTAEGAYGGFLPTVSEWTKMNFSGPGTYIWFKTTGSGYVSASGCFSSGDPQWINNVLTWGGSVSWKSGVSSPPEPTSAGSN